MRWKIALVAAVVVAALVWFAVSDRSAPLSPESTSAASCDACASRACTDGGCDPVVFLTSKSFTGALGDGGVAGADALCAELAAAAGLGGTFRAWLSARDAAPPATRFTQRSTRPYRRVDGVQVAASFAALVRNLDAPISVTETRESVEFAYVWTGAKVNGTPTPDAGDCDGWTSSGAEHKGASGESDDTTDEWTSFGDIPCSKEARLYCFEQRP